MTKFCPLCKKVLLHIGGSDYICQTRVKIRENGNMFDNVSHYEDRSDNRSIIWIALPYKITTTEDHRSCIYKLEKSEDKLARPEWKEIAVTSEIHPDTPERLAKRIKLLVPFT